MSGLQHAAEEELHGLQVSAELGHSQALPPPHSWHSWPPGQICAGEESGLQHTAEEALHGLQVPGVGLGVGLGGLGAGGVGLGGLGVGLGAVSTSAAQLPRKVPAAALKRIRLTASEQPEE
jgi:hypothetical protein